jgi:hypothetical protein
LSSCQLPCRVPPAAAETVASVTGGCRCHRRCLVCSALCHVLRSRASWGGGAVTSSLADWMAPLARGVSVLRSRLHFDVAAAALAHSEPGPSSQVPPSAGHWAACCCRLWPAVCLWECDQCTGHRCSAGARRECTRRRRERNAVTETRRRRSALWMQTTIAGRDACRRALTSSRILRISVQHVACELGIVR